MSGRLFVHVNLKFGNRSKCKTNCGVWGYPALCVFEDACICQEWLRLKVHRLVISSGQPLLPGKYFCTLSRLEFAYVSRLFSSFLLLLFVGERGKKKKKNSKTMIAITEVDAAWGEMFLLV